MGARRMVAMVVASTALVVLASCQRVDRVTSSTYQGGLRCFAPALSADGTVVAFSTQSDPLGETKPQKTIRRVLADGASVQLAGDPSLVAREGISGDGSRIAFLIWVPVGDGWEKRLYLWTKASGTRTRISPLGTDVTSAVIDDAGRTILYTAGDGTSTVYRYDVVTKVTSVVDAPTGSAATDFSIAADLSGDGRYVVLHRLFDGQLFVRDLAGSGSWAVPSSHLAPDSVPSISADGRWLVYSPAVTTSTVRVLIWDRTTGTTRQVTASTSPIQVESPVISGDATRLAYVAHDYAHGTSQLIVRDRASGRSVGTVAANDAIQLPTFSGDGHRLAFCSDATDLVSGGPDAPNLFTWTG